MIESAQELLDFIVKETSGPDAVPETIREMVWPAVNRDNLASIKPRLRVVPLERIGVVQGKSGSRVMLAYFVDAERADEREFRSAPLVLKVGTAPAAGSTRDDLLEEKKNADLIKAFITNREGFALPFHFAGGTDKKHPHSLIWSRFTGITGGLSEPSDSYWLRPDDLRNVLKGKCRVKGVEAESVIREAIELLRPLHDKNGLAIPTYLECNIVRHYLRYLRGILREPAEWPDTGEDWALPWKTVWALHAQENVGQFGLEWKNPFWVLEHLRRSRNLRLLCGVVHGDLHPRNVVLTGTGHAHIIDFGWSGDMRHISQDFVLLECNLRFFVQNPALPFEDLLRMSAWIRFDESAPVDFASIEALQRVRLITAFREAVRRHYPSDTDWDVEYVLPLFLTALGLLKHMSDCENQLACHITILSLAGYISTYVLPQVSR